VEDGVKARCQCGRLSADLPARAMLVVACHCVDCQRRSGSPFGLLAYFSAAEVTIRGEAKRFERTSAEGNLVETFFCPDCGSTSHLRVDKHPSLIGIPVGTIADPAFREPDVSVWEQSMHHWIALPGTVQHCMQNYDP
jgi:hypothetical protein